MKDPERWVMHKRIAPSSSNTANGATTTTEESKPSTSAAAQAQAQASTSAPSPTSAKGKKSKTSTKDQKGGSLRDRMTARAAMGIKTEGQSDDLRSGRPKIKFVISTSDGTRSGGRRKVRGGGDQDDDEFDYEEDFQDDEEGIAKIDDLADEDETKELEERIRKEMRGAERPDEIPDDAEEEDEEELTGTGKEVKKLVKKADQTGNYESDDEENPYASVCLQSLPITLVM